MIVMRKQIVIRVVMVFICSIVVAATVYANDYDKHYTVISQFIRENTEVDNYTIDWMTKSIIYYSSYHQVQPLLLTALIKQESNFNMYARSSAGAYGLTQIIPSTASGLGINSLDPNQNIEGGSRYLATQLYQYQGYGQDGLAYALAAYNAGPNAVKEYHGIPPYRETINYIERIYYYYGELIRRYNKL